MGNVYDHKLKENLSICEECGFVFATPSLSQNEFDMYYNDALTLFNAEESYSIQKRLNVIGRYINANSLVAEVGGNTQSSFKKSLESICSKYYSFDINESACNSSSEEEIPIVDLICCYYVLEHIVNINEFIEMWGQHLAINGYFVIEVPDLNIYYYDSNALSLTEHVNHFTPEALSRLMMNHGYVPVNFSRCNASRNFGFVSVFKRKKRIIHSQNTYLLNKAKILEGLDVIDESFRNLNCFVDKVHEKLQEGVLLWCANDMMRQFLDEYDKKYQKFKGIIIDEDERKAEFYKEYVSYTSKRARQKNLFDNITYIYIFSEIDGRVKSVYGTIMQQDRLNEANIYYTTQAWKISAIKERGKNYD